MATKEKLNLRKVAAINMILGFVKKAEKVFDITSFEGLSAQNRFSSEENFIFSLERLGFFLNQIDLKEIEKLRGENQRLQNLLQEKEQPEPKKKK